MQTQRSRFFARCFRLTLYTTNAIVFAGVIVHLILRDEFSPLAPIAYAFPYPLAVLATVVLAGIHGHRGSRITALVCLVIATISIWKWVELWGTPANADGPTCGVLFWNAAGPSHPSSVLVDTIRAEQPELVGIVEAGSVSIEACNYYERDLPGYKATPLPAGMMVFTRGQIDLRESRRLPNRSTIHAISCELSTGPTAFILADIGPDPFYDRKPLIEEVLKMANEHRASIIMGDFNTPYDSVHFDSFRKQYRHALKSAHAGPIETWPYIAPCLAIDHVWTSPPFRPVKAEKRWTIKSDHAMLLIDLAK